MIAEVIILKDHNTTYPSDRLYIVLAGTTLTEKALLEDKLRDRYSLRDELKPLILNDDIILVENLEKVKQCFKETEESVDIDIEGE